MNFMNELGYEGSQQLNITTIIKKANPHPVQKRGIVEMMLILTHGKIVSKEIFVNRLEPVRRIHEQLMKKHHEVFEANRLNRGRP
jgi:hypothetical protein